MGNITSEGLANIGRIDDNGYVFTTSNECIAKIDDNGYINKLYKYGYYGKIDEDGTIRNEALDVIGRIQADGYVYIHSKRVCHVSSEFMEKITPLAWNAGNVSSFSGRGYDNTYDDCSGGIPEPLMSLISMIIVGLVIGVVAMICGIGGIEMLLVGPIVVILFIVMGKVLSWFG